MKLKGTEILLKVLEEEKVDIIFGYPGRSRSGYL